MIRRLVSWERVPKEVGTGKNMSAAAVCDAAPKMPPLGRPMGCWQ